MAVRPDLLSAGIYTVPEAAALLGVTQARIRGWVGGYSRSNAEPLIQNALGELGRIDGRIAFSFANLMEMKFVKFFEDAGLSPTYVRSVFREARRLLSAPHPFATKEVFRTDGKKIIEELVFGTSGSHLYDLKTRNYEMKTVVANSLMEDVIYDAQGVARGWYPRRATAPNVILLPRVAFGRPVLRDSATPTRTIADAVQSERSTRRVAEWFELPEKHVKEAVRFEKTLRKAA